MKTKQLKHSTSQRTLKVGEEIRHRLADILLRETFYDETLLGVSVTVSEVSVSADFSNARVYITLLGGGDTDNVLQALNQIAPQLQHRLSKQLTIRRTPRLTFLSDSRFETASRLDEIILKNSEERNDSK